MIARLAFLVFAQICLMIGPATQMRREFSLSPLRKVFSTDVLRWKSYGYSCRHLETTQSSWLSHQIERIILEWPSYDFVSSHFLLFFPKLMMEFSEQLGYYAGL